MKHQVRRPKHEFSRFYNEMWCVRVFKGAEQEFEVRFWIRCPLPSLWSYSKAVRSLELQGDFLKIFFRTLQRILQRNRQKRKTLFQFPFWEFH